VTALELDKRTYCELKYIQNWYELDIRSLQRSQMWLQTALSSPSANVMILIFFDYAGRNAET